MKKFTIGVAVAALATTGVLTGSSSAPAQAAAPQCGTGDLHASYASRGAGAGHHYGVIRLENVSGHTCRTGGYGGLSYVGRGDGTQVGAAADRDAGRVRTIVLRPGDRAASRVDEANARNYPRKQCRPTKVDGFRVYVPDSTRSQFVKHRTTGCARAGVHLISHRPFHAVG